ncbi:MAG: hypothetical protein H6P98_231 [Candidatus Aminicenantes bacterium]|jgi:hypothetical protein|nr:hypothetical protein [Candidatus Aminicenantes bacterium]
MAEVKPFAPVKLITGIIASREAVFDQAAEALTAIYGPIDLRSPSFPFDRTEYYEKQMGKGLSRIFLCFLRLVPPESLSNIKLRTNSLEEEIRISLGRASRIVNIDPGILTSAALIMATAKDFAHRIPLRQGIYAHLELLFTRSAVKLLPWTYPDFHQEGYKEFLLEARQVYLRQLREASPGTA